MNRIKCASYNEEIIFQKEDKHIKTLIASRSFDSYFEAMKEMDRLEKSGHNPEFHQMRNRKYGTLTYTITVTI